MKKKWRLTILAILMYAGLVLIDRMFVSIPDLIYLSVGLIIAIMLIFSFFVKI